MSKLDIGKILTAAFEMYSKHWQIMLKISAIIYLIVAVAIAIVVPLFVALPLLGIFAGAVALVLLMVASVILQGMYVLAVDDLRDGRQDLSLHDLFTNARPFLGPLMGAAALVGLGVLGGLILIIPGIIFAVWWSVVGPVVVFEGKTGGDALRRSRTLVDGNGWEVFGLILITQIIAALVSTILGGILSAMVPGAFMKGVISELPNIVTAPLVAIVPVLTYFALRGEKTDAV